MLALAIALGAFHRAAALLFVIGFAYTQLIDVTNYLNHHYLVVLLGIQLALLPANAAWSIDARRRPEIRRGAVPAWMGWLLRFQVGVVYVFAGLAKAKPDWLLHGQPLNLWLAARTETPVIGALFTRPWAALAMAWAGFAFDTTIVLWLSWRRTRGLAFAAVIVFHGLTGALFNIGMFPVIMTSSALTFFSPSWPRGVLGRLGVSRAAPALPPGEARPPARGVCAILAIHVALQIALPLRHLVYPGDVLWNEDGMRFAWHVLIREKHGKVTFVAAFADGRRLEVPPHDYLTPRQDREMSGQPDLILQLAHQIGRDLAARPARLRDPRDHGGLAQRPRAGRDDRSGDRSTGGPRSRRAQLGAAGPQGTAASGHPSARNRTAVTAGLRLSRGSTMAAPVRVRRSPLTSSEYGSESDR